MGRGPLLVTARRDRSAVEREGVVAIRTFRSPTLILTAAALVTLALGVSGAAAAAPERETITFSDTFEDEELTAACGVDVTTSVKGRLTFITFPDRPVGPQNLTSVHVNFVASAGDNRVRFKDVGIDLIRVAPDGTVTLMIVGQVPFEFTGALKINQTTDEVILEPRHTVDTTRACRLLTR